MLKKVGCYWTKGHLISQGVMTILELSGYFSLILSAFQDVSW